MTETLAVYVVDDDEAVLLSVQALLGQRGFETHGFLSAERFLAEAPIDQPGCVVSDVQMPGINGVELQRRLLEGRSPLSVVVVTGAADVRTAVTLMENGAVTLLEKPYDQAGLLRAIERGLAASDQRWRQQQDEQAIIVRLAQLSEGERAVMQAMLSDEPNKAIAHKLDLGMRTIDRRRRAVLEKMGVSSVIELSRVLASLPLTWRSFATAPRAASPDEQE